MIKTNFVKFLDLLKEEDTGLPKASLLMNFEGEITPEQTVEIRQDIEAVVSYFEQKYRDNGEIKELELKSFMEGSNVSHWVRDKPVEDEDLPF